MSTTTTNNGDSWAKEAAKLAAKLWSYDEGAASEKPDKYLKLVNDCAKALRGVYERPKSITGRIG
ncbi:MAG: hypothetical protein AAGH60_02060 [Pseudomonadota bacterium]